MRYLVLEKNTSDYRGVETTTIKWVFDKFWKANNLAENLYKTTLDNRLEDRNIFFLWEHEWWWYNLCELKRWLDRFLRWEIPEKKLKNKTFSIEDQNSYWKDRWFKPRLERLRKEWEMPKFNRLDYSITYQLSWK